MAVVPLRLQGWPHIYIYSASNDGSTLERHWLTLTYMVMACVVMACMVMACIVMAHIIMACIVMACIVMRYIYMASRDGIEPREALVDFEALGRRRGGPVAHDVPREVEALDLCSDG